MRMQIAAAHDEISHPTSVVGTLAQDARRVGCLGPFSWKKYKGYGFAPLLKPQPRIPPQFATTHTAPMRESIEPRGAEVKKDSFMEGIKLIEVNDLWSRFRRRKGGAAGGGAGRSWALG